jgi:hypothetical protein
MIFFCPGSKVRELFSTFCMKQKVEPRLRFATDGQAKIQAIQNAPLEWPGPRTKAVIKGCFIHCGVQSFSIE